MNAEQALVVYSGKDVTGNEFSLWRTGEWTVDTENGPTPVSWRVVPHGLLDEGWEAFVNKAVAMGLSRHFRMGGSTASGLACPQCHGPVVPATGFNPFNGSHIGPNGRAYFACDSCGEGNCWPEEECAEAALRSLASDLAAALEPFANLAEYREVVDAMAATLREHERKSFREAIAGAHALRQRARDMGLLS